MIWNMVWNMIVTNQDIDITKLDYYNNMIRIIEQWESLGWATSGKYDNPVAVVVLKDEYLRTPIKEKMEPL